MSPTARRSTPSPRASSSAIRGSTCSSTTPASPARASSSTATRNDRAVDRARTTSAGSGACAPSFPALEAAAPVRTSSTSSRSPGSSPSRRPARTPRRSTRSSRSRALTADLEPADPRPHRQARLRRDGGLPAEGLPRDACAGTSRRLAGRDRTTCRARARAGPPRDRRAGLVQNRAAGPGARPGHCPPRGQPRALPETAVGWLRRYSSASLSCFGVLTVSHRPSWRTACSRPSAASSGNVVFSWSPRSGRRSIASSSST